MKRPFIILIALTVICAFAVNSQAAEVMDVNIHGFLSQGWIQSSGNNFFKDTKDGSFQLDEIGINFSKEMTDKLRVGLQLFAKDYGEVGNNDIVLDWAYGDYHLKDWLGFRVGKVKIPHGLYNETRDVDMVRTFIFLPQSIYPDIIRDVALAVTGAAAYGSFDLHEAGTLSYQFAYGTHDIEPAERKIQSFLDLAAGTNDAMKTDFINVDHKYSVSLVWDTPLDGLRLSGTMGDMPFTAQSTAFKDSMMVSIGEIITFDFKQFQQTVYSAEYTWNDLVLAAEYMETERDFIIGVVAMGDMHNIIDTEGYYVSSSYRLTDWFSLGAYYGKTESESVSGMTSTDSGRNYQKDMALTTRYDINEYMTLKMEGHKLKGTNLLFPFDNPEDASGNRWTEDWDMFVAKVTFSF